jgi:hypothetical protein
MLNIAESNMLLRTGIDLPVGLNLVVDESRNGWSFLRTGNAKRLEKKIHARGWTLTKTADVVLKSGIGKTAQQATATALKLALHHISEHFNALEVERIELTQYPWFFLAGITVYPYLIQRDIVVPALHSAVSVRNYGC